MKTVRLIVRRSGVVCHNPNNTEVFVFPTRAMTDEWRGVLPSLAGLETYGKDGTGCCWNFMMSNGQRSHRRDGDETYDSHMMPEGAVRSVEIIHTDCIYGFKFFDKDRKVMLKIGFTESWFNVETVLLA